jgi:transposase-like protein
MRFSPLGTPTEDAALEAFDACRSSRFPRSQRVLYTTNALENAHWQLRKIIKTRGHFLMTTPRLNCSGWRWRNITLTRLARATGWPAAMNYFAILYGERLSHET